jgi:hypothetical protein
MPFNMQSVMHQVHGIRGRLTLRQVAHVWLMRDETPRTYIDEDYNFARLGCGMGRQAGMIDWKKSGNNIQSIQ